MTEKLDRDALLLRAQLEDAVAQLSPPAHEVFELAAARHDVDDLEASDGFDTLTPADQAAVKEAVRLRGQLEAEGGQLDAEADEVQPAGTHAQGRRWWWVASGLYSLACLIAVVFVLADVYAAPPDPGPEDTVLTNPADVGRYQAAHPVPPTPGAATAVGIPTGVYINLVQLTGPYTVEISGQIWQRYADNLPKNLTKGVFLPNAVDQPTLTEVYHERLNNEELIGWTFHATLRERFDYSTYPMGHYQIRLRMWHPDFERNVYLTPDLQAYISTDPAKLPGVDQGLIIENTDLQGAFFSYRTHAFNTDFGAPVYQEEQNHPELYYSLLVRKHLASPLIASGIVPVVSLVLLFVLVLMLTKDEELASRFGVTPNSVVFAGAAFLLSSILSHNALRDDVQAPGLVYLEYLYFITYLVTVCVVANAALLVARPNFRLFRRYDNLWVKLLYWPVIMSTVLVVSMATFGI